MNKLDIVKALLFDSATPCGTNATDPDIGRQVLVRTYSAGVHFGTLESRNREEGRLANARRIWSWNGANTLHEIALRGVNVAESKISEAVPSVTLTNIIEVIPLQPAAIANLGGASWT